MKHQRPPFKGIDGLNQMLRDARRGTRPNVIHRVVMGNESADLDSMVSVLVYAYYHFSAQPTPDSVPIPVINIPRADFTLRKDAAYLFHKTGIAIPDLTFGDEIDLAGLGPAMNN